MDLLRWVLLALGLLLLAAIWLHGRRQGRAQEAARARDAERDRRCEDKESKAARPERREPDLDFDPTEFDEVFASGREPTEAAFTPSRSRRGVTPTGGKSASRQSADEQSAGGKPTSGKSVSGKSTGGQPASAKAPAGQPAGGGSASGKRADGQSAGEQRANGKQEPAGDRGHRAVQASGTTANSTAAATTGKRPQAARAADRAAAQADRGHKAAPEPEVACSVEPEPEAAPETETTNSAAESAPAPAREPERVVALYVVGPPGQRLSGQDLREAFDHLGLQFGDFDIFHRRDRAGHKIYSVANAVEPGTFDPPTMADMETPGVALVARLPGAWSPTRTFDEMALAARTLAERLGGRALDDTQSTLTRQTEQAMRDELLDYEHRRTALRR